MLGESTNACVSHRDTSLISYNVYMNVYTHDVGTAQSEQGPVAPHIKHMAKTKAKMNGYNTRLFPGGPPPQY